MDQDKYKTLSDYFIDSVITKVKQVNNFIETKRIKNLEPMTVDKESRSYGYCPQADPK